MSTQTIPMPKAGEMMETGVVVEWLVAEGDEVAVNQPIAIVDTDKVEFELESPYDGKIVRLIAEVDAELDVGEPVCEIETTD